MFVHGIGGGDRFLEIARSVSLVVICGYNTRRAKKTSFVAGGASTAVFFMRMNHKGLPGKTWSPASRAAIIKRRIMYIMYSLVRYGSLNNT